MTATEQFIKDAVEGGFELDDNDTVATALLMPETWQAVGKTRGWLNGGALNNPDWYHKSQKCFSMIMLGKTIDQALEAIT